MVNREQREWCSTGRTGTTPDKFCATCGAAFFTDTGLSEHTRLGCANGNGFPVTRRRIKPTPGQRNAGLRVTTLNNARRIRCLGCDTITTPSGIVLHQRASGHAGKVELS